MTAVGASAVLAKPFEPQVLVSKVRELLESGPVAASITPPAVPDAAAAAADVLLNASHAAGDAAPSVDDYFERLDRAFAGLTAPLEPRDPLKPSASRTHAKVATPETPGRRRVASEASSDHVERRARRRNRERPRRAGWPEPSRRCSPSSKASCRRPR